MAIPNHPNRPFRYTINNADQLHAKGFPREAKERKTGRLQQVTEADLATERKRQLTTGKRTKRTELDFRCPIYRFAIGQSSCLISARRHQLTFHRQTGDTQDRVK